MIKWLAVAMIIIWVFNLAFFHYRIIEKLNYRRPPYYPLPPKVREAALPAAQAVSSCSASSAAEAAESCMQHQWQLI